MRRRRDSGSRFGAAAVTGLVLLCIALGLMGCEDESDSSGENKIIAFKIGEVLGSIAEVDQQISITVPTATDLINLKPVVTVSEHASVSPGSEETVNITHPVSYTVTAENGVTRTYTVTVSREPGPGAVLESIQIRSLPIQTIYERGESFSPAGLVVIGSYSDGSVREETGYTLTPAPVLLSAEGNQMVTVSVGGKTTEFTVSVQASRLESISVVSLKTNYPYGEAFNPTTDIVVTGYYSDGTSQTETVSAAAVTGYDSEKAGEQTLLVTLNGKTRTFSVFVQQAVRLESISVNVNPLKTSYAYGEAFNLADIAVTGYYSDGTSQTETVTDAAVTGYDSEKPGTQTLVVTLGGKTATFMVTVQVKRDISVTIGLPNTNQEPEIFGLPEGGIKLSVSQSNDLPRQIIISAAGSNGVVYSQVQWYIDGDYKSNTNILQIDAWGYALKIPHSITFVGTRNGVEYSRDITFTVEK
jgi:hypothetical protein